jgi:hypothetical protein
MGKRPGLRARLRRAMKDPGDWTVLTFGDPHADCEVCRVLGVTAGGPSARAPLAGGAGGPAGAPASGDTPPHGGN